MIDRETIRGPLGVSLACVGGLFIVGIWLLAPLYACVGSLGGGDFSARVTDSQSVAGEGARGGDLSAEDMGAIPEILTDEQIATLNKPETLAKVKEASAARLRVTNVDVEAELEAYWKRLFAHLRTFQFSAQSVSGEGARSSDLSAEDMGAMPEILTDEQIAQIATLNKPETLAKVKEVFAARSRVTDPYLKAELEAYWKRLFAHLRTFQTTGGSP